MVFLAIFLRCGKMTSQCVFSSTPAKSMSSPKSPPEADKLPRFWRDAALPFVEARSVANGGDFCYARHTHPCFSIGTVTVGQSLYLHRRTAHTVGPGAVVLINPETVHACNPVDQANWSYRMFYVDTAWLAGLQHELGFSGNADFRTFPLPLTWEAEIYHGLNALYDRLVDDDSELLEKHSALVELFCDIQQRLRPTSVTVRGPADRVKHAADYIADNYARTLTLEEICRAAGLSQAYLIRAFKKRYGMTPHAYLLDCRIRHGRTQLKRGRPIAEVALATGFADQAHFQRAFKRFVAATPRQYRRGV